jgi:alpha-tubulin suppressor-like RCC1 family protein
MRFRGGILVGIVMVLILVSIQMIPIAHSSPAVRTVRPHTFPLPHPQRRVMAQSRSSVVYGGGSRAMVWGRSCPGCVQWPTIANADLVAVEAWRNGAVAVTEAGKMVPLGGAIPAIAMGRPYFSFDSLGVRNNDVVKVAAGWSHALFLRGDGSIDGWGDNYYQQISIPDEALCGCIVDIAAGSSFSLFLRDDGTVFSWGSITLADGTDPVEVAPLDIASAINVVKIGADIDTMYVLYNDGTMSWWGRAPDAASNVTINALTDVVDFDVAGNQGIAIKANGDIVGWGSSTYFSSNGLTGNLFANTHTAVAASVGYSFGLVLRDDGTVLSYGYPRKQLQTKKRPSYSQKCLCGDRW